jgi:hypothetical protein
MPSLRSTREILEAATHDSRSISDVLLKLGLRLSGGGHAHIKRRLAYFQIDTSHFLGARASSGRERRGGPARKRADERLVLRDRGLVPLRIDRVRRCLLELGRTQECAECGLGPRWNGRPLVLQVDHINGLHHDYRPENLQFLCPNCHSQTVNFAVRNRAYAEVVERQTRTA